MTTRNTFISNVHNAIRKTHSALQETGLLPHYTPQGVHKEYLRMPRIPLPAAKPLTMTVGEAMDTRHSFSATNLKGSLSLVEAGTILGHALGIRTGNLRHYPSGGALFPIETYLIGKVLDGHEPGVFHYHPKAHALEQLWSVPEDFVLGSVLRTESTPTGAILIVFTSVWERSSVKYGKLSYSHALLEAGHMAQNILLCATALEVEGRPVSGFHDDAINALLDLDGVDEQPVYAIMLSPSQTIE